MIKKQLLKFLEIVLRTYSKRKNIYARKSIKPVTMDVQPATSSLLLSSASQAPLWASAAKNTGSFSLQLPREATVPPQDGQATGVSHPPHRCAPEALFEARAAEGSGFLTPHWLSEALPR